MATSQAAGEKENRENKKHLIAGTECPGHGCRLEDPGGQSDEDMEWFEKNNLNGMDGFNVE